MAQESQVSGFNGTEAQIRKQFYQANNNKYNLLRVRVLCAYIQKFGRNNKLFWYRLLLASDTQMQSLSKLVLKSHAVFIR